MLVGNAGVEVAGSRAFLATDGGATLRLDERLVATLGRGRAVRLADRSNDDVDWAVSRFLTEAAPVISEKDLARLATLTFTDDFRSVEPRQWSLNPDGLAIEPI
jgi:hypothetical protein